MKLKILLLSFLAVFLMFPFTQSSFAYTIDGDVIDWGIDLNIATSAGDLDSNLPWGGLDIDYVTEDNADQNSGSFNVGPGWSIGNLYDVEAMYFDNDATYGYIAIITGLPEGNNACWPPGDIGIDVSSATAGLLDQGTPYSPTKITPYEYGINLGGNLMNVSEWNAAYYDGSPDYAQYSDPWAIYSGTNINTVDLVYSENPNGHYVIEASFLLLDLGLQPGDSFGIHWTMQCGNDFLNLEADVNPVPEPATMLLLGSGLIGLAVVGRKKFRKN